MLSSEINVASLMSSIKSEALQRSKKHSTNHIGKNNDEFNLNIRDRNIIPSKNLISKLNLKLEEYPIAPIQKPLETKEVYNLQDFLNFHDEDFIHTAYKILLGRPADQNGLDYYLKYIRKGGRKEDVLAYLRFSPEGRAKNVKIRGVFPFLILGVLGKIPIINSIVEFVVGVIFLPKTRKNIRIFNNHVLIAEGRNKIYNNNVSLVRQENEQKLISLIKYQNECFLKIQDELNVIKELTQDLTMGNATNQSKIENLSKGLITNQNKIENLSKGLITNQNKIENLSKGLSKVSRKHEADILTITGNVDSEWDAFYSKFEDRFRGTRAEIKSRQKIYLPFLSETYRLNKDLPIIDLGCGRGEWLELLRDNNIKYLGVDTNQSMIERCEALNLSVTKNDCLSVLEAMEDNSIGGITGFHIVEHLPYQVLRKLFKECYRVISPGGIIIFETPNPENLKVGACNFYFDPTHKTPLPSLYLNYLAESHGFLNIQIKKLHLDSIVSELPVAKDSFQQRINDFVFTHLDYALIATKGIEKG